MRRLISKPFLYLQSRHKLYLASFIFLLSLACFLYISSPALAAVPKMLNYQGRLTDANDNLYTTTVYMKFEIWDAASAGNKLWSSDEDNGGGYETCGVSVTPSDGVFNIAIGDTSLSYMADLDLDFNTDSYWLQIKIQESAQCPSLESDYETLSPRQRILSSGYSINADTLDGAHASSSPAANQIPILDGSGNLVFAGAATVASGGSGALTLDSASGTVSVPDNLSVTGAGTHAFSGTLDPTNVAAFTLTGAITGSGSPNITGIGQFSGSTAVLSSSVTSPTYTGTAAVTLSSGGTSALTLDSASGLIVLNDDLFFEKGTYDTTFSITTPTAARTITFPDASGTVAVSATAPITLSSAGAIGLSTPLAISYGGTAGTATPTAGAVAYGTGSAYAFTAAGTSGQPLLSGGTGAPSFGTLGVGGGGTGLTSLASGSLIYGSGSSPVSTLAIGSANQVLYSTGTAPAWGTIGGSSITPDSLDFSEFKDAMTLDANLTISASANNYSINIDSNTLFVDTTNNRIGIGTTAPAYTLDVSGTGRFTGALTLDTQATAVSHAVRASRTISASTGLSGGGDLTADRSFSVIYGSTAGTAAEGNVTLTGPGAGSGLTGGGGTIAVGAGGTFTTINVGAGSGISVAADSVSLGNLTADWSQGGAFDIKLANASSELKIMESVGGLYYAILDAGDLAADQTFTFATGGTVVSSGNVSSYAVTSVGAGSGLTGGGGPGAVTLNVGAGTDISVAADAINNTSTLATVTGRGASTTSQLAFNYNSGSPFTVLNSTVVTNLNADMVDGQHYSSSWPNPSDMVTGSGTANYVSKWTGTYTQGNSIIYDNGTNVGIGTTDPKTELHVEASGANTLRLPLRIVNPDNTDTGGTAIGIHFSTNTGNYGKGALVYERKASYGRGDFHFLQRTSTDWTNPALSDAVLTIKSSGNVGIGTTGPVGPLTVDAPESNKVDSSPGAGVTIAGGSSGNADIELRNNGTGTPYIDFSIDAATTDYDARIRLTGTDYLAIEGTNVGIGTAGPSALLDVAGNMDIDGNIRKPSGSLYINAAGAGAGITLQTGGTDKVTLTDTGNVGIGTTGPTNKLHVYDSATNYILAQSTGGWSGLQMNSQGTLSYVVNDVSGLSFFVGDGSTVDMRILNGGNVGIGTTAPDVRLHLYGATSWNTGFKVQGTEERLFIYTDETNNYINIDSYSTTGVRNPIVFQKDGGNVGIGTTSPDDLLDAANAIDQGDLKTTTGEVSYTSTQIYYQCDNISTANRTLPGGQYGFYPQIKTGGTCPSPKALAWIAEDGNSSTSYVTNITLGTQATEGTSGTLTKIAYAQQRYIQASPPYFLDGYHIPHFIYFLWDKETGELKGGYQAEDPPWENNGGNKELVPHPFYDYLDKPLPENLEIAFIDPTDVETWKTEAESKGLSLLEYLNNYMEVDPNDYPVPISPKTGKPITLPKQTTWRRLRLKPNADQIQVEPAQPVELQTPAADLAEYFAASSLLGPGDIVDIAKASEVKNDAKDDSVLVKSKTPYSPKMLGIISTNPAHILNVGGSDGQLPLALTGRVPVKVSNLNGPIKIGDPITSSEIPGVGMRATKAGPIVGKALESFDDSNGEPCPDNPEYKCGKTPVFINLSWYDPEVMIADGGELVAQDGEPVSLAGYLEGLGSQSGSGEGIRGWLKNRLTSLTGPVRATQNLIAAKIITPMLHSIKVETNEVETEIISPVGDKLVVKLGKEQSSTKGQGFGGLLEIQNTAGEPVVTITDQGDVTAQGHVKASSIEVDSAHVVGTGTFKDLIAQETLEAQTARLGSAEIGELDASKIVANDLEAGQSAFEIIKARQVHASQLTVDNDASVSGALTADSITAYEILRARKLVAQGIEALGESKFGDLVAEKITVENLDVTNREYLASLIEQVLGKQENASREANTSGEEGTSQVKQLAFELSSKFEELEKEIALLKEELAGNLDEIEAEKATFKETLKALGSTSLASTTIAGPLSQDGTLLISEGKNIDVIGDTLFLQSEGLGAIDFIAGRMTLDREGNLVVGGRLTVAEGLFTDKVAPASGEKLTLEGDVKATGSATFGDLLARGDLAVSGTARFNHLQATGSAYFNTLAASGYGRFGDLIVDRGLSISDQGEAPSVGTATILAGSRQVVVPNTRVTQKSRIFVTADASENTSEEDISVTASEAQETELFILEKVAGAYFVVATEKPAEQDLTFNWLMVN